MFLHRLHQVRQRAPAWHAVTCYLACFRSLDRRISLSQFLHLARPATALGLCFGQAPAVPAGRVAGCRIAGKLSGAQRDSMRAGRPRSRGAPPPITPATEGGTRRLTGLKMPQNFLALNWFHRPRLSELRRLFQVRYMEPRGGGIRHALACFQVRYGLRRPTLSPDCRAGNE